MTRKRSKPPKGLSEPETAYRDDERLLTDAEWKAWEERNKDALQESFRKARAQIARGEGRSLDEVMARVRATIKRIARKP